MLFWLLYAHILFWDRNKLKQIHFIFIFPNKPAGTPHHRGDMQQ